ncbi:hypothetical protein SAMN04489761_2507 [Tenacibaculum sp. MAR_2009_124]|uniref:hypothetical protein n=1 Tax=Tenacibaculum sp. MAR_2009_124 TaxID=1250059 RepID=UPI000899DC42|nr:hypothetical protein [Tenacibaculum sp. MAR_2009_124]SEC25856.1 hypothetical protein SAMN04489761_2507 [Tenacibaculum sp. MAR_2009_124]
MKKIIYLLLISSFNSITFGQENKLLNELRKVKEVDSQVSFIMDLPIKNLKEDVLTDKLGSELNTISSCIDLFARMDELEVNKDLRADLKKRTEAIATELFKAKCYVLLKNSGGYAPVYGVGLDTISGKKVAVVHLGGDCSYDESDKKKEELTAVSNSTMNMLLREH